MSERSDEGEVSKDEGDQTEADEEVESGQSDSSQTIEPEGAKTPQGTTAGTMRGRASLAVRGNHFRNVRWTIALIVLGWSTVCLLTNRFEICNVETVAGKSEDTVTRTCDRPTVKDAGVVAVGLFIVLLLVPDMSEVGVFGVSLKRRLQAVEGKVAESVAKTEQLETRLLLQNLRIDSLKVASSRVVYESDRISGTGVS